MKPFTSFTALLTTSAFVAMTPMVAFANQEYLDAKKANCGNSTETRCGDWFYEYWYGKNQFEEYNCDAFLGFRRNDAVCNSPNMKIFEEVNSFGDFFLKSNKQVVLLSQMEWRVVYKKTTLILQNKPIKC